MYRLILKDIFSSWLWWCYLY